MIIRCERCSTLYDLDETLLAPEGSPVQCAKCQAVFTAVPPRPGTPAMPPVAPSAPLEAPAGPGATPAAPIAAEVSTVAPRRPPPGPNIYRRPQPAAAPAAPVRGRARAGAPARDAVSAMEARLRAAGRWKLALVPLAILAAAGLAYAGWSAWKRLPDPESQRQLAEATALLSLDDASSLGKAVDLLETVQQGDHASRGAAGQRGLARALLVTAQAEEVEPLQERLAAAFAEKARLEREQPPGAEDGLRALAMEVARVEVELGPRRKLLEAQRARTAEELQAIFIESRGVRDAARGQAVLAVLDGNVEEVQRTVSILRAAGPDHWADLVELWLAVRKDGASRDQAIPRLAALASAHPQLLRARLVLARALLAAGRREEAISSVALLLSANPHHERAQRLRAQLAASTPPPAAPVVAPQAPAPRPAWIPRPAPPPPAATNAPVAPVVVPATTAGNQAAPALPAPVAPPPSNEPAPAVPAPPKPAPKPVQTLPDQPGSADGTIG